MKHLKSTNNDKTHTHTQINTNNNKYSTTSVKDM